MLDFYLIKDHQNIPDFPEQAGLEFVAGLDNQTFTHLQTKGIIDARFDYYSDFRWDTKLVQQIRLNILDRQLQSDTDVKKLMHLLEVAEQHQSGLMAYCD